MTPDLSTPTAIREFLAQVEAAEAKATPERDLARWFCDWINGPLTDCYFKRDGTIGNRCEDRLTRDLQPVLRKILSPRNNLLPVLRRLYELAKENERLKNNG